MKAHTKNTGRIWTLIAALLLSGGSLVMTACNTTEGVGKDVEAAGEGIQDAAN